jgi:hypothetical protein
MDQKRSKRLLQITLGLLATAPLFTGLIGLLGIDNPIYATNPLPVNVLLDSNLRFLNGLSVGLGLALYWIIPEIKSQTIPLRIICGILCVGALGRLCSMLFLGLPPMPMPFFALVEVLAPPLIILWQKKIAL